MTNRSKAVGTAAEGAVLKVVQRLWPAAERLVLHGSADQGDIGHCGQFVFEVKSGATAENASRGQITKWMDEAHVEAKNRGVRFGVLVTKRRGLGLKNAEQWYAHINPNALIWILGAESFGIYGAPVTMELGDLLFLIESNYGQHPGGERVAA